MDPHQAEGNCVIIEHKNNEYSMLAHLKQRSIDVKVGEVYNKGKYWFMWELRQFI